jgi:hypothetical protein
VPRSGHDGDLVVLQMIFRELVTTVLSTEIVDSQNVPNGTDLRQGASAASSNENERPDTKTIVLSSLSKVRCRNRAYFVNCIQVVSASSHTSTGNSRP